MARYSSKNTDSKSSRSIGKARGISGAASVTLTTEQQAEVDAINLEIEEYKREIARVRRRKDQIEDILSNFEQVAVGSILVDILPDEDSDEIKNSIIVSKQEVLEKLGFSGDSSSSTYTISGNSRKARAGQILLKAFKLDLILELIDQSSDLSADEMYVAVLRDVIYDVSANDANDNQNRRAREKLEDVFDDLEAED